MAPAAAKIATKIADSSDASLRNKYIFFTLGLIVPTVYDSYFWFFFLLSGVYLFLLYELSIFTFDFFLLTLFRIGGGEIEQCNFLTFPKI